MKGKLSKKVSWYGLIGTCTNVCVLCYCMCFMLVIGPEPKPTIKGDFRTFRVWLDTNQYQKDMEGIVKGKEVRIKYMENTCI